MISILFENDAILKETSFGLDLLYQSEFKLLKRRNADIWADIKILKPDVLFINLSEDFNKKVKSIYEIAQNIKIVLLVNYNCDHVCWIAKKHKISGILQKNVSIKEFNDMLISIFSLSDYLCVSKYDPTIDFEKINDILTPTEIRVLKFVGMGLTTLEISGELNTSKRTIDNHRMKILQKLGCKDSSRLIYIASIYNLFQIT